MGCTLPSLLAAEMTLKRARRGAKICTRSSSSMCLYLISSSIVAKGHEGSSGKDSSSSPKASLHCLCPACTHGKRCARQQGETELQSAMLTATCSLLRELSFCFLCWRNQPLPPRNSKDQLPALQPTRSLWSSRQSLAKQGSLLCLKVSNPSQYTRQCCKMNFPEKVTMPCDLSNLKLI